MKKILCTLLVLIASVVSAYAQDALTAKNVTVPKGGSEFLEIELTNEKPYGAFQFELKLPAGISATNVQKTSRMTSVETKKATFSADVNITDAANNIYTVAVYNDKRLEFAGSSGTIILVTLAADKTVSVGSVLEGQMNKVALSDIDAHQTDVSNSTFTINIVKDDGRLKFYETSEVLPDFEDYDEYNVTVFRTFNNGEWSTICLPFAMDATLLKNAFGNDYVLAEFNGYEAVKEGNEIVGLKLNCAVRTAALLANKPYFIKPSKDVSKFEVDERTLISGTPTKRITETNEETGDVKVLASFKGTYSANTVIPNEGLFLSSNSFYYSVGKTKMKAFRAYVTLGDVLTEVSSASSRISMSFEDPTGINEIKAVEDDRYYNLSGQQVKPEKKGLYIQNGKKKIIK